MHRQVLNWQNRFKRCFEIDLRALGLFRISLGLLLLCDLYTRAHFLEAHYTDEGVLPRTAVLQYFWYPAYASLHMLNGTLAFQIILFLIATTAAVSLLLGWRTRLASIISWVLLISLQTRNPLILQGGDILTRSLLFWGLWLPLGARYSLDANTKSKHSHASMFNSATSVYSVGGAALLLQVPIVYCCTALLKNGPAWMTDGSAIYYALHIEQFAKPLGVWLRQYPEVMRFSTFAVWWFEMVGPLFLFLPFFFLSGRAIGILGFVGLHVGLNATMELGVFPYASSIAMIPFLPMEFFNWLETHWSKSYGGKMALSVRNLFNQWNQSLIATIENIQTKLARLFPHLVYATGAYLPSNSSSPAHSAFAGSTSSVGESKELKTPLWLNLCSTFFLSYVLLWNLAGVPALKIKFPESLNWIADLFRIDQEWDMFAPYPARDDGWYVIPGQFADGTEADLFRNGNVAVDWTEPKLISARYQNDRERSYMMGIWQAKNDVYRPFYADNLCHRFNSHPGDHGRLKTLSIYFMSKDVMPNYEKAVPTKNLVLYWECNPDTN